MTPHPTLPRGVRALLFVGARLVPRNRRARWREEWRAELGAEWARRDGVAGAGPPLWRIAWGSLADARAVRAIEREAESGGGDMGATLRPAIRALRRRPAFAGAAVLTLAMAIGATVAIFTLLDRVVFSPVGLPDADRLVSLQNDVPCVGPDTRWSLATAQAVYYGEESRTLDRLALTRESGSNLQTDDGPLRVRTAAVSIDAMELLAARALHGRVLTAEDDRPGAPPVAVLAHAFWERALGGDAGVVGTTLDLDGTPVEVVGVMAPGVALPWHRPGAGADLWTALRVDPAGPFQNNHVFPAVARLAPGVEVAAAQGELDALGTRLPDRFPDVYSRGFIDECGFRARAIPLTEDLVGDADRALWLLFGAVGLVLLVAAANVANLVLVRLESRRGDLAVRMALGAGLADLRRLLWTESLLLAGAGSALGLLLATWGVPALARLAPEGLPGLEGLRPGPSSVAFAGVVGLLVAAGITATALSQLGAGSLGGTVRSDTRTRTAGPERQRLRAGLVVGQMALALLLVVGAGLLIRSQRALAEVDPGFDAEGVLTAELFPTPVRGVGDVERWVVWRDILDGVRALPGVGAAGLTTDLPLSGGFGCTVQGFADPEVRTRLEARGTTTCAGQTVISPGAFDALGIPVEAGRALADRDLDDPSTGAVVVSREFADRFWPGEDPLGKAVAPSGRSGPWYRVVGVVGDVPRASIGGEPANAIYYPAVRIPESSGYFPSSMTLVVRTGAADPLSLLDEIRAVVARVDPTMPLANAAALSTSVDRSMAHLTFVTLLLRIAAAAGLGLAAVGLYGVVSFVVAGRTREIGTRIALGAVPRRVEWMVLRTAVALAVGGLAVGAVLAAVATRWLESLLFGVEPLDPATLAAGAGILLCVATVAAWGPARRASRVDPATALRAE